jgi:hypothetical protein
LSFCTFSFGHCVEQQKHYKKRVWRYQKGNQNPCIEEEQTTQWPKEKVQKDKKSLWVLITPLVSSNSSCPFVLFLLAIVLSVLLRYMDSDCPFGTFKLFFYDGISLNYLKIISMVICDTYIP